MTISAASAPGARSTRARWAPDAPQPEEWALVAEDDQQLNRLFSAFLTRRGFRVVGVESGEAALRVCASERQPPALALIDYSLPELNGLDTLAWIRARSESSVLILLTGLGSEEVAMQALHRGASEYIKKPVTRADLEAMIERRLTQRRLQLENEALREALQAKVDDLEIELHLARQVQMSLLPERPPQVAGYTLAAQMRPAREVGGDFYGMRPRGGGGMSVFLGDISGKGLSAALLTGMVSATVSTISYRRPASTALYYANLALYAELARSERFATCFLAQLAPGGRVRYADAGHGYALIQRAARGTVKRLRRGGLPLGLFDDAPMLGGVVHLAEGDTLAIVSDGLIEATRADGAQFGVEGVAEALRRQGRAALDTALAALFAAVDAFAEGRPQPDDQTVVLIRKTRDADREPAPRSSGQEVGSGGMYGE